MIYGANKLLRFIVHLSPSCSPAQTKLPSLAFRLLFFLSQVLHSQLRSERDLQKARQHDESLLLVAVTKLLAVGALLALGPVEHLRSANGDEESNGPVTADEDDTHPRQHLEHVVGAGHEAEAIAHGDLALGAASGAERRQISVDEGVASLTKQVQCGTESINDGDVGLGGEGRGAVDEVGAQGAGDGPVEEAVLEDVEEGHGVGGELVDEERLVLALDKVQHNHAEREPLGLRHVAISVLVQVGASGDDGGVDEDRAEVLDDEDSLPANLGAFESS